MAQYVDKDALVSEIERRRDAALTRQRNLESIGQETVLNEMIANELNKILSFIDTLEVKEVDLEKEMENWIENNQDTNGFYNNVEFAKHFFELGINANNNSVIEKACEWLKNNVTYTHPRTGETKCVVNLNAFIDAMKGE